MKISSAILAELYRHAQETYPFECCGFLLGPAGGDEIGEIRRCENQQDELHARDPKTYPRDSRRAYSLDPADIFFLDRSLRMELPVRIVYHSHVDAGAYFSDEDKAFALFAGEPAYPVDYLVIDARRDRVREARLFSFDPQQADYVESTVYPGEA